MAIAAPTGRPGRIPQVDALRGCAVLLIFFVHYHALFHPWLPRGSFSDLGTGIFDGVARAGTDLFFILSGFLVYGSLMARERRVGPYIVRRFLRIYPTFLFVVGVYLVLSALDAADSKIPAGNWDAFVYILANLLLLPGFFDIEPIVAPAWSLSYLGVFYIGAPVLVAALKLRQRTRIQRVILFAAIATALLVSGYLVAGPGRLAMFAGGMLLYEFRPCEAHPRAGLVAAVLLVGTFVLLAMLNAAGIHPVIRYCAILLLFPLTAAWAMRSVPTSGPLHWNWLHYLGRITLSYIMIHGLVLRVLQILAQHAWPAASHTATVFWLMLLPAAVASTLIAAIVYAVVENPDSGGLREVPFLGRYWARPTASPEDAR